MFVELAGCIMVKLMVSIPLVGKEAAQFADEFVHLCQVAGTEVLVERLVHKFLKGVNREMLTLSTLKKYACK